MTSIIDKAVCAEYRGHDWHEAMDGGCEIRWCRRCRAEECRLPGFRWTACTGHRAALRMSVR